MNESTNAHNFETYHQALTHTFASLQETVSPHTLTAYSNLTIAEIEELQLTMQLLLLPQEPNLQKFEPFTNMEVAAENKAIDYLTLVRLRGVLVKRQSQFRLSVNDFLILFRSEFGSLYKLSS